MLEEIFNDYKITFDKAINDFLPQTDDDYKSVVEAMRYSLCSGGKRIRPILLCEFYRLFSGNKDDAVPFALALEMIHTYSLIHDDLPCMDNDDMRRGKPSCHITYGENIAVLAGDALLTEAFNVASKTKNIDSNLVIKAISLLSQYSGYKGMVGGQVIDLQSENKQIEISLVKKLYSLKTGALIKAACKIGAVLGGADEAKTKLAEAYAENVGLAFQIIDDILDVTADEKVLGKPVLSDEKNEKSTYVSHYGIEKCRKIAKELTDEAIDNITKLGGDNETLIELTKYLLARNY